VLDRLQGLVVFDAEEFPRSFGQHRRGGDAVDPDVVAPEFAGDSMRLYQNTPVADLTSIDFAPASGYDRAMIQAVPGYGYVFQRLESVQYHYMALRVTAVTRQYVIFDWSVQTDQGNPELVVPKRPATSGQAVASR